MSQEEEVRRIAYRIWEEEGRPEGRAFEHWLKAVAIWEQGQRQEASIIQARPLVGEREAQTTPALRRQRERPR